MPTDDAPPSAFPAPFVLSDHSLLLRWPERIDPELNQRILAMRELLWTHFGHEILDVVPTYHSLAIHLKPPTDAARFAQTLLGFSPPEGVRAVPGRQVTIPVCYEEPHAPDLPSVAEQCGIEPFEVIRRHTEALYRVYFLGFLPGFPYLGGMDARLATPRLKEPRRRVEGGSVGIAGHQTGVYPTASPGGWNLIGRTPLLMFRAGDPEPTLLQPGDEVRFVAIDTKTFLELSKREMAS